MSHTSHLGVCVWGRGAGRGHLMLCPQLGFYSLISKSYKGILIFITNPFRPHPSYVNVGTLGTHLRMSTGNQLSDWSVGAFTSLGRGGGFGD